MLLSTPFLFCTPVLFTLMGSLISRGPSSLPPNKPPGFCSNHLVRTQRSSSALVIMLTQKEEELTSRHGRDPTSGLERCFLKQIFCPSRLLATRHRDSGTRPFHPGGEGEDGGNKRNTEMRGLSHNGKHLCLNRSGSRRDLPCVTVTPQPCSISVPKG